MLPVVSFARIMPIPPAWLTVWLFVTRPLAPRSQITTAPSTLPASSAPGKQRAARFVETPRAGTSPAYSSGALRTDWLAAIEPTTWVPLPSTTDPWKRLVVLAPTVVTQGAECETVPGVGPSSPAAAETKTPAAAAFRKASSTTSAIELSWPETE